MIYLDRLAQHWANTIQIAKDSKATELQIQALESLAESEFGYRSVMRLKPGCFWSTKVDQDGDVVLYFVAPWVLGDDGSTRQGERVNVYIDHLGVLTMKNMDTEATFMYDPYEEQRRWNSSPTWEGKAPLIWVLDNRMLKPFVEPGVVLHGGGLLLVDTGEFIWPYISRTQVTPGWSVSYWDGPISGYARVDGRLHYYTQVFEEEVDGTRVYALHHISGWQAFKAIANSALWHAELKFNRLLGWPGRRKFKWKKFTKFNTDDHQEAVISGYTTFGEVPTYKCQE